MFPEILAAEASIISVPPAVLPSWTLIALLVVFTEISPAAPVNELFWAAVPLLNCTVTAIIVFLYIIGYEKAPKSSVATLILIVGLTDV